MSYCIDICFICLKYSSNLMIIRSHDRNGINFKDKLKYFVPEMEIKSNIPKYICAKCERNLCRSYEFKQKCLRNFATYEKYAQQITMTDGSYKYLSVVISPDFVYKQKISDGNDYDTNILQSQTEMNVDLVNSDEVITEESILNDELLLEFKEEHCELDDTCIKNEDIIETLIIEEEAYKESVLEDESDPLLSEIKEEHSVPDDTCSKNGSIIGENVQISNNSASFQTRNGNSSEQNDEKLHKCEICNKSFKLLKALKRHRRTHKKKSYTCKVCNKSCGQLSHLRQHLSIHSDEKPFTCEVCNKSFRHMQVLKHHKRVHTGEKPYTCEVCNKSFSRLHSLKNHNYVHTGERPFNCEICNKSFRKLSHLKEHKFVHTGGRSFICEVCNQSFKHSSTLKKHTLLHTAEKSSSSVQLQAADVPYSCRDCCQPFTQLVHICSYSKKIV